MCEVSNCQDVTIRRCKFSGKNLLDVALNISGEKTKNVTVEYCIFENMTTDLSNGGEPIRLGNSQYSGCVFDSTIRKCIFRNLKADPETISIKSCGNLVEDNHFIENKSMVTVRHGGLTTIQHNTFQGMGGVRLLGYGNKVEFNRFENNRETGKLGPVVVQNGIKEKDPNWTNQSTPSGKEGNSHANYAQNVDNVIENNEWINCVNKVYYRKDNTLSPKGLKIDLSLPQPPVPDPDEHEEDTPTQPEPKPPEEAAEDPPTHARLCQLGHNEEAKIRIAFYVCRKHLDDVQPHMQDLLNRLRDMAKRGEINLEE